MKLSFKKNLGNIDRTIRIALGISLLVEGITGY